MVLSSFLPSALKFLACITLFTCVSSAIASHHFGHAQQVEEPPSALCQALSNNDMSEAQRLWRDSANVYQHGSHAKLTACVSKASQLNWLLQRGFSISSKPDRSVSVMLKEKRSEVFARYTQLVRLDPTKHQDLMLYAPDVATIKLLHQQGIPIDFPTNGADPLMAAIPTPPQRGVCPDGNFAKHENWGNGGAAAVTYLCQNGAKIQRETDSCNHGTLSRAAQLADIAIVDALIDHCGVPVNGVPRSKNPRREGPLQIMMRAVDGRQPKLIRHLASRGAEVNIASNDWRNTSPLITAVVNGDQASVTALLELGAKPDYIPTRTHVQNSLAKDGHEYFVAKTALVYAVEKHPKLVPLLLKAGANPGRQFGDGETALSLAVSLEKWDLADQLYNARKANQSEGSIAAALAKERLISGVKKRNPAAVKQALKLGVPLATIDNAFSIVSDPDSARQLLAAGANPNNPEALEKLIDKGNWATAKVLLAAGADPTQVADQYALLSKLVSAYSTSNDLLQATLSKGLNPNFLKQHYGTAFTSVASGNREDRLETMLAAGADPSLRPPSYERKYWGNKLGWDDYSLEEEIDRSDDRAPSPLMAAIKSASYDDTDEKSRRMLLTLLAAQGKKMGLSRLPRMDEIRDNEGRTLAMQALNYRGSNYKKAFPLIRLLLDLGINQHARDHLDRTALIHLAMADLGWATGSHHYHGEPNTPAFNEFIRRGASASATDKYRRNALHYLSYRIEAPRAINLLALHGANVNQRDENGVTPLMFAAANQGGDEVVQQLLNLGADPNLQDRNGWTALQWAYREHIRRPYAAEKNIALLAPVTNLSLRDRRGTSGYEKLRLSGFTKILKSLGPQ